MFGLMRKWTVLASWLLVWAMVWPGSVNASSPEFSPAQKAAFDRTVSGAESALADKLTGQRRDFDALRQAGSAWEQKIAELHYNNEEDLIHLRKRVLLIDSDKLAKLKTSSEQTKERYRKLFDAYRSLNLQLETARTIGSRTLIDVLRTQTNAMKIPVQLARQDIRSKDAAYQAAKKTALAKIKKVRDTLSAVHPLQVQIKAAKSALGAPKDSRWSVWKSFTPSLNKRDAKTAAGLLGSVNALSVQIIERLQKIHQQEMRIAEIIRNAEALVSQSG